MYLGRIVEYTDKTHAVHAAAASLHRGAAGGRAGARSRHQARQARGAGRRAEPAEAAAGLPLPHPLPLRRGALPGRDPGPARGRARPPRGVPPALSVLPGGRRSVEQDVSRLCRIVNSDASRRRSSGRRRTRTAPAGRRRWRGPSRSAGAGCDRRSCRGRCTAAGTQKHGERQCGRAASASRCASSSPPPSSSAIASGSSAAGTANALHVGRRPRRSPAACSSPRAGTGRPAAAAPAGPQRRSQRVSFTAIDLSWSSAPGPRRSPSRRSSSSSQPCGHSFCRTHHLLARLRQLARLDIELAQIFERALVIGVEIERLLVEGVGRLRSRRSCAG